MGGVEQIEPLNRSSLAHIRSRYVRRWCLVGLQLRDQQHKRSRVAYAAGSDEYQANETEEELYRWRSEQREAVALDCRLV